MYRLELSPDQQQLLVEVLECCLSDLRVEIVDTDTASYKDYLKERKHLLAELLEMLKNCPAQPG